MTTVNGCAPGGWKSGTVRPDQQAEYDRLTALVGTYQTIAVKGRRSTQIMLRGRPAKSHGPIAVEQEHRYLVRQGTPVWIFILEVTTDRDGWPAAVGCRYDTEFGFRPGYVYPLPPLSIRIGA